MENKIIIKEFNGNGVRDWDSGMPIGNGRLGAMVPGLPGSFEVITLNQDTIWYGPHKERDNPDAKNYVKKIRSLLKEGNVKEADKLCYTAMTSLPKYFGAYEPLGELQIYFNHYVHYLKEDRKYERVLDFDNAIVSVDHVNMGVKLHRECFASYPDECMVFKFTADSPILDMHFNIMRRPCDSGCDIPEEKVIHMHGQSGPDGVKFDCLMSAQTDGKMERIGDFLSVKDAKEVIIYVTASSDFYDDDPYKAALDTLNKAMEKGYDQLKKRHIEDYSALYSRAKLDFGTSSSESLVTRLQKVREGGKDKGLFELLFNYGRYLLISSSREGSQAANLQGIWNKTFAAPWECNYTLNINTECNYWIAEKTGLSECHMPLFDLIERMVPNGEKTAKNVYGCNGFVGHHTTNLWGDTSIEGVSFPSSVWPMGGAWLSLHMWEHYLYTKDREFLKKRAFPVLKKAALFFSEYLDKSEDGYYITGPSLSPENRFFMENGYIGRHCMAPEMDNQIVRALMKSVLSAYDELGVKDDECAKFREVLSGIRPTRVNSYGGIMEWDKDYREFDTGHRHFSPFFDLYPGYEISPDKTPHLAKACEVSIKRRLRTDDVCANIIVGWTSGWAAALYARLFKAEDAVKNLYDLFTVTSATLLNNAPCFQIDGNFTGAAAIVEMLLYSDGERIVLLPALPKELEEGSFSGLRAKGGFIIDVKWKNGKAYEAKITSLYGGECRIKADGLEKIDCDYKCDGEYFIFETQKGQTYELEFKG